MLCSKLNTLRSELSTVFWAKHIVFPVKHNVFWVKHTAFWIKHTVFWPLVAPAVCPPPPERWHGGQLRLTTGAASCETCQSGGNTWRTKKFGAISNQKKWVPVLTNITHGANNSYGLCLLVVSSLFSISFLFFFSGWGEGGEVTGW